MIIIKEFIRIILILLGFISATYISLYIIESIINSLTKNMKENTRKIIQIISISSIGSIMIFIVPKIFNSFLG